jgi:hypothetical protein
MNRQKINKINKISGLVDKIDHLGLILQSQNIRLSETRYEEETCRDFRFSVVIDKEIIESAITEYISKLKAELKELGYED